MHTKNTRTARVNGGSIVVGLDGLETVLGKEAAKGRTGARLAADASKACLAGISVGR